MAMIKCRICGKKVSSKVSRCPKCGAALKLSIPGMIFLIFIIVFVIGIVVVAILDKV
jgi:hypothetical protein